MTFIYKLDPYCVEIHRTCKYELHTWSFSNVIVWQTDTHTESTNIVNQAASPVVSNNNKARWQATRRLDANSVAARQALDLGCHSGAHASGLLCERDGSLRWCSSWTGGRSKVNQIRLFDTDRSPVSTDRSRDTWPLEWVIDRFLFGAGPQDRVCFRRQPRARLSFPAHFDHNSTL